MVIFISPVCGCGSSKWSGAGKNRNKTPSLETTSLHQRLPAMAYIHILIIQKTRFHHS